MTSIEWPLGQSNDRIKRMEFLLNIRLPETRVAICHSNEQEVRPSSLADVMTFFRAEDMWDFWLNVKSRQAVRRQKEEYELRIRGTYLAF